MNFVVDAQLPPSLCEIFTRGSHDAIHTLQLPMQNKTPDRLVNDLSFIEQRVVVTKDSDFFYSHLLQGRPWKLLLVRTGKMRARKNSKIYLNEILARSFRLLKVIRWLKSIGLQLGLSSRSKRFVK